MRAVTWHGKRDVRVDDGSRPGHPGADRRDRPDHVDGHLRLRPAPVRGARRRSWTRATSSATSRWASSRRSAPRSRDLEVGDRVVMPFQISCGTAGCATSGLLHASARPPRCATRAWAPRCSATPSSTAQVPGGQAEYLRVPQAQFTHDQGARGPARRAVPLPLRRAADRLAGGRLRRRARAAAPSLVLGLGPIGDMACPHRAAPRRAAVIGVDLVPERLARARRRGVEVLDLRDGRRRRRGRPRPDRRPRRRRRRSTPSAWRRTARRVGRARPAGRRAPARRGRRSR